MHREGRIAPCWLLLTMALASAVSAVRLSAQTPARTAEISPETQFSTKPTAAATTRPGGALLSTLIEAQKHNELKFYSSPIGNMLVKMRKPLSFLTGGLIQPTSPKAIAQHAANGGASGAANSPSGGAAAKIKADAAAAKQRQANVRYLGTVDCHWYPEAEAALIASLRADRSECVRHEAAVSLGRGCCCTKKTVEALKICIAGSNRDGNPSENSLRVRLAAFEALQNCLANCAAGQLDASPPPTHRPEYPFTPLAPQESSNGGDATAESDVLPDYYRQAEARPWSRVIGEAQQIVSQLDSRRPPSPGGYGTGRHNLYNLWVQSAAPASGLAPSLAPKPTPAPTPAPEPYEATSIAARRGPQSGFDRAATARGASRPEPTALPVFIEEAEDSSTLFPAGYSAPNLQRTPPIESDAPTRRVDYQQPRPPNAAPSHGGGYYAPR